MKRFAFLLLVGLALLSCRTVPTEIPEDLTQAELVQLAQESADQENWDAALAYYQAVLDRFPQDRAATVAARYEMAFIEYKRGDLTEAQAGFEQVLGFYDFDSAGLPQWPRVLASRLLQDVLARREALSAADAGAETGNTGTGP